MRRIISGKPRDTRWQFIRYLFVGGAAAAVDTSCLYVLYAYAGINHLLAAIVGFFLGSAANYFMSLAWVFESTGKKGEFALFMMIGAGGLAWTELILWVFVNGAQFPVMLAKALALALVVVWNFGMRKKLVFANL